MMHKKFKKTVLCGDMHTYMYVCTYIIYLCDNFLKPKSTKRFEKSRIEKKMFLGWYGGGWCGFHKIIRDIGLDNKMTMHKI